MVLVFGVQSQENNPIITAVPSLSIAPDARAGGMGDIGAATDPDINSQYWNASKYVFMESEGGLSVSYTPWLRKLGISDINLGYLSGYWKFNDNQAVSTSLRFFSLGDIELMNQLGEPEGSAHPNELAFDVAYSMKFSENMSGAVALRYIRSDLNNGINTEGSEMYPGNAFAADISTYYKKPIELSTGTGAYAFGVNISNIGSKISYDGGDENNFLPTNLRAGGSFTYPIDEYQKVSLNLDVNKLLVPTPDSVSNFNKISPLSGIFRSFSDAPGGGSEELKEIMWSLGAEYIYNNQFAVRAGYYNESKYKGNRKYFTVGAGFKLNVFQIDAAYVISAAPSNPLDQTLRLSLSFDMLGLNNLIK